MGLYYTSVGGNRLSGSVCYDDTAGIDFESTFLAIL